MSGRKVFTAGEVLQAADVNDFLMDQSVMVFAGTAARGSAIPSPTEGMVTYRSDDDAVEVYDGSSWNAVGPGQILQIVSTAKTDVFSTTSSSFTDITGLNVTITPSSASNKILVSYQIHGAGDPGLTHGHLRLLRDATVIAVGDSAGNRARVTGFLQIASGSDAIVSSSTLFLDSPGTTSAITYKMQTVTSNATGAVFVNRSASDSDAFSRPRGISTITVMEVAG